MTKSDSPKGKAEEELNKFRKDLTFIAVGLLLALGIQNILQFIEIEYPHLTAYFYLSLGVASLVLVLVFLGTAARLAGIDKLVERDATSNGRPGSSARKDDE